ncbi:MAG: hypothetical protein P8X86_14045 [Desulfofustis sp.]
MSVAILDFAEPFFTVKYVTDEAEYKVAERSILVNLSVQPIRIESQKLAFLESVVVTNITVNEVERSLIVERFADYEDEAALYEEVKKVWPLAYDIMYHSGSVPLNVGLHKDHVHCGEVLLKEVHTQIVGYGKMQQCLEKDIDTLYLEEPMAPGTTHKPMFDERGNYPWHQYETITPAIFMAIEVLPSEADAGD